MELGVEVAGAEGSLDPPIMGRRMLMIVTVEWRWVSLVLIGIGR